MSEHTWSTFRFDKHLKLVACLQRWYNVESQIQGDGGDVRDEPICLSRCHDMAPMAYLESGSGHLTRHS